MLWDFRLIEIFGIFYKMYFGYLRRVKKLLPFGSAAVLLLLGFSCYMLASVWSGDSMTLNMFMLVFWRAVFWLWRACGTLMLRAEPVDSFCAFSLLVGVLNRNSSGSASSFAVTFSRFNLRPRAAGFWYYCFWLLGSTKATCLLSSPPLLEIDLLFRSLILTKYDLEGFKIENYYLI